jgi:CheY-like chemotaxis protein
MTHTILVVENEPFVLEALKEILAAVGMESICVSNGEVGVEMYREHVEDVDLVVLDMNLPGMKGAEVYRVMKQINPEVKVIVSSGYDEAEVERRFGDVGGVGDVSILKKPFNVQMFLEQINSALAD